MDIKKLCTLKIKELVVWRDFATALKFSINLGLRPVPKQAGDCEKGPFMDGN
jgi:hypothetical protein